MVILKRNAHKGEESNSPTFQISNFTIKNYINRQKPSAINFKSESLRNHLKIVIFQITAFLSKFKA